MIVLVEVSGCGGWCAATHKRTSAVTVLLGYAPHSSDVKLKT